MFTEFMFPVADHVGRFGWGAPVLFVLTLLFWVGVIVLFVTLISRRRHNRGTAGYRAAQNWQAVSAARSAESTLAERFAQGDIDEVEYRARLEVLRANSLPLPSTP